MAVSSGAATPASPRATRAPSVAGQIGTGVVLAAGSGHFVCVCANMQHPVKQYQAEQKLESVGVGAGVPPITNHLDLVCESSDSAKREFGPAHSVLHGIVVVSVSPQSTRPWCYEGFCGFFTQTRRATP